MHFEWKSYGGSLVEGVEGQFHFGLMVKKFPSTNGLLHERANADNII